MQSASIHVAPPQVEKRTKGYATRICIKNIPPKLTSSSVALRRHLASILPSATCITEIRILKTFKTQKSRNMAFVGFSKPEYAEKCVTFFDQSYCGTSKLVVEWAFSEGMQRSSAPFQPWAAERKGDVAVTAHAPTTADLSEKKNIDTKEHEFEMDLKKREFVALQQSNGHSWQNDDNALPMDDGEMDASGVGTETAEKDAAGSSAMQFLKSKVSGRELLEEDDNTRNVTSTDKANTNEKEVHGGRAEYNKNRLFLRNVSYQTTEADLQAMFSPYGKLDECHIPLDDSKHPTGIAFVSFSNEDAAEKARKTLDRQDFQGRILHILPAQKVKQHETTFHDANNPASFKLRKQNKRKQNAANDATSWNASYLPSDAVLHSTSNKLQMSKADVLNLEGSSGNAAVRMAMAETQILQENKAFFASHGIDLDALSSTAKERSQTMILVKNLPPKTTALDLNQVFNNSVIGGEDPTEILLPPSNTLALVMYQYSVDAKRAFRSFSYKRFLNVPLYLEWAPLLPHSTTNTTTSSNNEESTTETASESNVQVEEEHDGTSHSIFIKNLNFSTTEEQLHNHIQKQIPSMRAVKIPTKILPNTTKTLSLGYGFVEFPTASIAQQALHTLQNTSLHGHKLELQPSQKSVTTPNSKTPSQKQNTKLIIRNIPFQASKSELHTLFTSYGEVKKIRIPRKFGDSGHRGFGFVEFRTHKEANAAMDSLGKTHLYGRHLVLEWASMEEHGDKI